MSSILKGIVDETSPNKSEAWMKGYAAGLEAIETQPVTAGESLRFRNPYLTKSDFDADEWNAGFRAAVTNDDEGLAEGLGQSIDELHNKLSNLEVGYNQAKKETHAIKYLETEVQEIVIRVEQLAEKSGLDMKSFEYAAREVREAFGHLESAVYKLDEEFKEMIDSIQHQIEDAEFDDELDEDTSYAGGGGQGGNAGQSYRLFKAKPAGLKEDQKKNPPKLGKINKKTGEGIFWTKEGRAAEAADRLGPGPPCVYCGKPSGNHSISFGKKNANVTHINPGNKTSDGYDDSDADEWGAMFGGMTPAEDHIYTPSPGWKNVTQDEIDFGIRTGVIPEDEYEEKDWEDDIYTRLAKIRERMARVGKKGGHLRVVKELDTWDNAENYKAKPAGLEEAGTHMKKESAILKGIQKEGK